MWAFYLVALLEDPGALDRLLPLCDSQEVTPRRYCIEELSRIGDPDGRAHDRLVELARHDPALHAEAAAAVQHLYGEPPPTFDIGAGAAWTRDPGRTRTIFFPTAYTLERGEGSIQILNLGYWEVDYGATDHVQAGLMTGIPIGAIVFVPRLVLSARGGPIGASFQVLGGILYPYVGTSNNDPVFVYGGGPTLSVGDPDRFLNLGFEFYGGTYRGNSAGLLLPHAGGSLRLGARVALHLEVLVPGGIATSTSDLRFAEAALVLYGLRIIGSNLWGDISFAAPICADCGQLYKYLPLGVPLLGFGFNL